MSISGSVTSLVSGELLSVQINPAQWRWYELLLDDNGTEYNAAITVDSETVLQAAGEQVWARFDVLVLNGTLPGNAQTEEPGPVISGSPYCWIDEECFSNYAMRFADRERVTVSFGFNASAPGGLMAAQSHLVVGVRADMTGFGVTTFSISATRLPRTLTDGMVIESALPPCGDQVNPDGSAECAQYFSVPVGAYDVLQLRLERAGDNLTYVDAKGTTLSNGGRGLVGGFYVGGPEHEHTPPPMAFDAYRPLANTTAAVAIESAPQRDPRTRAVAPALPSVSEHQSAEHLLRRDLLLPIIEAGCERHLVELP